MAKHIGFTGTQKGMTKEQKETLRKVLGIGRYEDYFHHGDCIGSDAQAHTLAQKLGFLVFIHPPINESKRAFSKNPYKMAKPSNYIKRNHEIVDAVTHLIATPKAFGEELRSGTWSTVRYARKKQIWVTIIWPDGSQLAFR